MVIANVEYYECERQFHGALKMGQFYSIVSLFWICHAYASAGFNNTWIDQWGTDYLKRQEPVRRFYERVCISVESRAVNYRRSLEDGNEQERQWKESLTYYALGDCHRLDIMEPRDEVFVARRVGWPSFLVFESRNQQKKRLYFSHGGYSRVLEYVSARLRVPFGLYCVLCEDYPVELEKFLHQSSVKVLAVVRTSLQEPGDLRLDFRQDLPTSHGVLHKFGSIWLNSQAAYVIVRQRFSYSPLGVQESYDDYSFECTQGPEGIPVPQRCSLESKAFVGPPGRGATWLSTFRMETKVISISDNVELGSFSPESFGISKFDIWWAWLRWRYLERYAITKGLFYFQLCLVILLVPSIAYRRWRRRRLERASSIGHASA